MNTRFRFMKFSRLGWTLLLAGVFVATAPQVFAQTGTNARLQTEVASKLSHDRVLQGQSIMVNANGSQITLSGTVQTQKQWQEAETVAANVNGVRTILNNLTIAGQNNQSSQSPTSQSQGPASLNNYMPAPPPPDAQQPEQPQAPATPSGTMNGAGIPPPPPPDQQAQQPSQNSQNNQGYAQPQQQARPEYQGNGYPENGYQGQSYGAGYGAQNDQNYNPNYNQYGNRYEPAPPQQPSGPVAVPAGTLLQIRTVEPLDSAHLQAGQRFDATVARDVWEGNVLAIPRGANLQGVVVQAVEPKGRMSGKPHLALQITSLSLDGQRYSLQTNVWAGTGPNKAGYTAGNTVTGGLLGAIVGGIIGSGPGAAVGAGLGAMTGMGVSSATKGPRIYIPAEAVLNFHLTEPVMVQPVSWEEARRIGSNVPQLQTQPRYRAYPRPYPYGYAYPPAYYSPAYPYYYGPGALYFGYGW